VGAVASNISECFSEMKLKYISVKKFLKFSLRNLEKDMLKISNVNSNNSNSFWVVENNLNDIIGCIGVRVNTSNITNASNKEYLNDENNEISSIEVMNKEVSIEVMNKSPRYEIIHMCVVEEYRNMGIAKILIKKVYIILVLIFVYCIFNNYYLFFY
jgi:hypothetical protein